MFGSYWFLWTVSIVSVLASVGGLLYVRRKVGHETLMCHHDVAGALMQVVGTLYAVVLGLVVVASLNKFEQARSGVEHEANSLRNIYSLAAGLPRPLCANMHRHCVDYATTVTSEEWKFMEGGFRSKKADRLIMDLSNEAVLFRPESNGESNLQQLLLEQITELDDYRAARTVLATPAFDPIIWSVLIIGGMSVVVFTYFFGVENFIFQILMTALVAVVLVLNMVTVALFDYPFSGDVRVWPVPFQTDLQVFQEESQRPSAPAPPAPAQPEALQPDTVRTEARQPGANWTVAKQPH
jgi:hypothetical protein